MSLFQAWCAGIVAFLTATLSLALAFSIAITGPPTAAEMNGIQTALGYAAHEAAIIAGQLGDEACVQLPPDVTAGFCPQQVAAAEPSPATSLPVEYEAPAEEIAPEEVAVVEPLPATQAQADDLLGGADSRRAERRGTETPRPEPRHAEARQPERRVAEAPRRARATPPRERRVAARRPPRAPARAAPVVVEPMSASELAAAADQLAAADAVARAEFEARVEEELERQPVEPTEQRQQEVAPERRPSQNQNEAIRYEDERYGDDDYYADDEDAYAAYEAEREYRRERRRERRARREQGYYGGW